MSYLPTAQQAAWRRQLQAAYGQPTYPEARVALQRLRQELRLVNASAVTSLDEGVEETLTLHRLGLFEALGSSLKTTTCLESIMAQIGQRTDKVDRWRTRDQKPRWVAAAVLGIEPRLRRIKGYRALPLLLTALQGGSGGRRPRQDPGQRNVMTEAASQLRTALTLRVARDLFIYNERGDTLCDPIYRNRHWSS